MTNDLSRLSDRDLLTALDRSVDKDRASTVDFLQHIAEVDARRLYLPEACSSMFTYCVERLRLAEGAAYRRIAVARAGRRFPVVFEMVRTGEVHLTAAAKLAPLLRDENHLQVLARAKHQTTAAVERLVAELAPRPDRPDVVRRVASRPPATASPVATMPEPLLPSLVVPGSTTHLASAAAQPVSLPVAVQPSAAAPRLEPPARVVPTAPDRYSITFTGDEEFTTLLREVRDLMGHRVPRNDLATVFKQALLSLRDELQRERAARTKRRTKEQAAATEVQPADAAPLDNEASAACAAPDQPAALLAESAPVDNDPATACAAPGQGTAQPAISDDTASSRHVPNAIRRRVWERDGGRCTFVNESGERCTETSRLELDHLRPFARHRQHSVEGIRLRCRAHNQWTAELAYGAEHMASTPCRKFDPGPSGS